jgi:hypothetical protein
MRKFKHIKSNRIATLSSHGNDYNITNNGEIEGYFPKWVVEDSNDWKEVKEYPKIVSFRNTTNGVIFHICEDGFYTSYSPGCKIGTFNKEYFLKESHFEIYQVAVSETEVFTLGDKVEIIMNRPKYSKSTISRFKLEANGCISVRVSEYCSVSLHDIRKTPEVLFVTEDGIEIFNGDKFYYISIREPNPACYSGYAQEGSAMNTNYKYFSTVEAAKKYIDENKPIYSKKQVREAIESSFVRENYILDTPCCCTDRFKEEIFKQKLGL